MLYKKMLKIFRRRDILLTQLVGAVPKCTKAAVNIYAPLMMVSILGRKSSVVEP
jgi:hypothetical protein